MSKDNLYSTMDNISRDLCLQNCSFMKLFEKRDWWWYFGWLLVLRTVKRGFKLLWWLLQSWPHETWFCSHCRRPTYIQGLLGPVQNRVESDVKNSNNDWTHSIIYSCFSVALLPEVNAHDAYLQTISLSYTWMHSKANSMCSLKPNL